MENMNRRDRQYKDAALGAFIGWIGILLFCLIAVLFTGCTTTKKCCEKEHVITEMDGDRVINWYTCKEKQNISYGSKRTNKTKVTRRPKK